VSGVRNVLAIAQRELKSYFVSPVAYVVTAFFLLVSGYLFALILLQSNEATLRYLQSNLSVIWLFVAPFLTMRLLAEEQRSGTIELLLTSPIRDYEVVLGKYLGALIFLLFMLVFTLFYPALLVSLGGHPDTGPMLAGYLGILLQAGAFLAVGLFVSSLTDNQMIAAVLSFAILLVLWLADGLSNNLGAPVREIFRYLSITQHFQDFPRGVIDTQHIVYFLSVIAACLVFTVLSLQSRRWRE
jgi:ABC-2 type transport system permease protein